MTIRARCVTIDSMKERWKDVIGFEGLYQVANLGRVRSLDRVVLHKRYGTMKVKGRILRPIMHRNGRLMVNLSKDGIETAVDIHRLVAAAWLGPCPDNMEICHGPNGTSDNSVSNLRYDTHQNNMLDCRRDGTHGGRRIRRSDGVEFISLSVAAEETGCYHQSICRVCQGKQKTAGGYGWEYVEISI